MDCRIIQGDCRDILASIEKQSIHLVVTDPPYFLDGLDDDWKKGSKARVSSGVIKGVPSGMKFDVKQGIRLQSFMTGVSKLMIEAMKPGAFALVFSQPRLCHRMAVGLEDAGFEIRDIYAWHFLGKSQFKAFSMSHFVNKMDKTKSEKELILDKLDNRKTAQLRPKFELIILAQKPKIGTHVENWMEHETGLVNIERGLDGLYPTTLMTFSKPTREAFNMHPTIKPVTLIVYLIKTFSKKGQTVMDPFLGSGTTAIACKALDRNCIGIEIEPDYIRVANKRLDDWDNILI